MTRKMILAAAVCLAASVGAVAPAAALELPKRPAVDNLVEDVAYGKRCTAVALTIRGRAVPGTRKSASGWRACARALRRCNVALNWRQARGLNPYAHCAIVRHSGPALYYNW
ncbi:MAG: hypothetical protein GC150_04565 [Rhizobiales bacterium]|nr:hypothetical protein [Hyphomicrobiales bacterium]